MITALGVILSPQGCGQAPRKCEKAQQVALLKGQ